MTLNCKKKIRSTTIHSIIIKKESNPDIKFEIFERLNTGSTKLNEDEIKALESRKGVLCEALGMESEYDCLFTDIKSVNELFTFEDEDSLNCDSEGLNKVLEFVK